MALERHHLSLESGGQNLSPAGLPLRSILPTLQHTMELPSPLLLPPHFTFHFHSCLCNCYLHSQRVLLRWQVVKTVLGHNTSGGRRGAGRNLFDVTLLCKDAHGSQGSSCNWMAFSGDRNPALGEEGLEAGEILSFRIMFKCESRISIVVPTLLMWFVASMIQPVICSTSYTALNLIKPHLNCDRLLC